VLLVALQGQGRGRGEIEKAEEPSTLPEVVKLDRNSRELNMDVTCNVCVYKRH